LPRQIVVFTRDFEQLGECRADGGTEGVDALPGGTMNPKRNADLDAIELELRRRSLELEHALTELAASAGEVLMIDPTKLRELTEAAECLRREPTTSNPVPFGTRV
jgi:hypothetical protein